MSDVSDVRYIDEAYEMHLAFHRVWSKAAGEPGYIKRHWLIMDGLIGRALTDKFGAGWLARVMNREGDS